MRAAGLGRVTPPRRPAAPAIAEARHPINLAPPSHPMPDLSRGRCLHEDPELFFPAGSLYQQPNTATTIQIGRAKAVCKPCPVRVECGAWAVRERIPEGIFGGLTPQDRRQIRRARGAA
jgi:WhiB family transcriptional regulator, redox-sensing transcriptional regulator